MREELGKDDVGAPGDAEPLARKKAADLLTLAAHPRLMSAGTNMVTEDSRTADREAYIGLGWAMVYLADAINSGAAFGRGDEA